MSTLVSTLMDLFLREQPLTAAQGLTLRDLLHAQPSMGGLYLTTPTTTTISGAGDYVKMEGPTAVSSMVMGDLTVSATNRITYTGANACHFHLVIQTTLELASGTNQDIGIQLYHYDDSTTTGALVTHSEARNTLAGTDKQQLTTHGDILIEQNDYIELHIANHTNTNNIDLDLAYMFGMGISTGS